MTLRIDVYAVGDLTGHCYVHFAFVFTLSTRLQVLYVLEQLICRKNTVLVLLKYFSNIQHSMTCTENRSQHCVLTIL